MLKEQLEKLVNEWENYYLSHPLLQSGISVSIKPRYDRYQSDGSLGTNTIWRNVIVQNNPDDVKAGMRSLMDCLYELIGEYCPKEVVFYSPKNIGLASFFFLGQIFRVSEAYLYDKMSLYHVMPHHVKLSIDMTFEFIDEKGHLIHVRGTDSEPEKKMQEKVSESNGTLNPGTIYPTGEKGKRIHIFADKEQIQIQDNGLGIVLDAGFIRMMQEAIQLLKRERSRLNILKGLRINSEIGTVNSNFFVSVGLVDCTIKKGAVIYLSKHEYGKRYYKVKGLDWPEFTLTDTQLLTVIDPWDK